MNSKKITRSIVFFLIFFMALEVLSRVIGVTTAVEDIPKITPKNLYTSDSVVGWKNSPGSYQVYTNDDVFFECNINNDGNRTAGPQSTAAYQKSIHVYGCSYIFGYSLADTATSCYKLQQMLPHIEVVNKGVPAYGLAQMYLSLKQSLAYKDTPNVAIFNYADFLDLRRPTHKQWGNMIRQFVTQNKDSLIKNMRYPYFDYTGDSLHEKYCEFDELPSIWSLSDYSAFVHFVNAVYFFISDGSKASYNHLVSKMTALAMMEYCHKNGIVPIFATITNDNDQNTYSQDAPPTNDIPILLRKEKYHTLDYGIDINESRYNCSPNDPGHPNGLAHSIFANKTYDFLVANKLVSP